MNEKNFLGIVRILLGLMFLIIGVSKIIDPGGMIMAFGFAGAAASVLGWIWILSETVFGLLLLIGWKVKYTAWPLAAILTLAAIVAIIPNTQFNPPGISLLFFHFVSIVLLIDMALTGAGAWAVDRK